MNIDHLNLPESAALKSQSEPLMLRNRPISRGRRTLIMAILNVTPDSFSGDGTLDAAACVEQALQAVAAGADIIDIGAESTRPGHTPVPPDVELSRIIPVLERLKNRCNAIISVDTRSPEVFRAAAQLGAEIFNSVAGFDEEQVKVALETSCPLVIMHQQPHTRYPADVVDCVVNYLQCAANRALELGCHANRIILDPGIGFGKLPQHNIALLKHLHRIKALGFPVLLGTSRKSTLGVITGKPVEQRQFATAATIALGISAGVDIVRVHDVAEMLDVVRVSDAIVRGWDTGDTGAE